MGNPLSRNTYQFIEFVILMIVKDFINITCVKNIFKRENISFNKVY